MKIDAKQRRHASTTARAPANVEEALVLAGEARGRQILRRRGTADRDRDIGAIFLSEPAISRRDRFAKRRRAGRPIDDLACRGGGFAQQLHVGLVEPVDQAVQLIQGLRAGECVAIGLGRQGEAIGHPDVAFRQGAIEFAQRRRLAAHGWYITKPKVPEPADVAIRLRALFWFLLHRNKPAGRSRTFDITFRVSY